MVVCGTMFRILFPNLTEVNRKSRDGVRRTRRLVEWVPGGRTSLGDGIVRHSSLSTRLFCGVFLEDIRLVS